MDRPTAESFAQALLGSEVAGWKIGSLLGHGKSAIVLNGLKDGKKAAVKIFDRVLIEKFGEEAQKKRIAREALLATDTHPNLIKIISGGFCPASAQFFVIMDFIEGTTLEALIPTIPKEQYRDLIRQIASACKFLEEKGIAHRDIKPANIMISPDKSHATLMDLGVIKHFGAENITGGDFIGTLRYASPEFLLGEVADTTEGWRAVTFYQLGAVLYDLLTKQPIFQDKSDPYAKLVQAVVNDIPDIPPHSADPDLVSIAQCCLQKNPELRLRLVTWDRFLSESPKPTTQSKLERIRGRLACAEAGRKPSQTPRVDSRWLVRRVSSDLSSLTRARCSNLGVFPPNNFAECNSLDHDVSVWRLHFQRNAEFFLNFDFWLFARTTILEPSARTVKVEIASTTNPLTNESSLKWLEIFVGVFDSEAISPIIDSFLCDILDKAQQATDAKTDFLLGVNGDE